MRLLLPCVCVCGGGGGGGDYWWCLSNYYGYNYCPCYYPQNTIALDQRKFEGVKFF